MLESPAQKLVFFSALGGGLTGFHAALLITGNYAAWVVFNLAVGLFLMWMASLIGRGLIRDEKDPGEKPREGQED